MSISSCWVVLVLCIVLLVPHQGNGHADWEDRGLSPIYRLVEPETVVLPSRPHAPPGPPTPRLARHSRELGDLFRLQKNGREARAALCTHQLGCEVRLLVGSLLEIVQTQVCRNQEDVLRPGEQWKRAMIEKGWVDVS